jgi:hypothetical protein
MIAAVSLHPGCSFLFVSGPPADHARMASFECSESNAVPVLDTIWAGLNGLGAISVAGDNTNPNQGQIAAVGISWLVLSGISAIYGYSRVSQCKTARHQRDERYADSAPPEAMPAAPPRMAPTAAPGMTASPNSIDPASAVRRASPAAPPATSVRAPATAPVTGTAPSEHAPTGSASPAPSSSLLPGRSRSRAGLPARPDSRAAPGRSLAMRPALATAATLP